MGGDPNNPHNCMSVGDTRNAAFRNKQQAEYCSSEHSDDDVYQGIDDSP